MSISRLTQLTIKHWGDLSGIFSAFKDGQILDAIQKILTLAVVLGDEVTTVVVPGPAAAINESILTTETTHVFGTAQFASEFTAQASAAGWDGHLIKVALDLLKQYGPTILALLLKK